MADLTSEIRSRIERLENRVDALELAMSERSEEFEKFIKKREAMMEESKAGSANEVKSSEKEFEDALEEIFSKSTNSE